MSDNICIGFCFKRSKSENLPLFMPFNSVLQDNYNKFVKSGIDFYCIELQQFILLKLINKGG